MPRTVQKVMTGWEFALIPCKPRWIQEADYGLFDADEAEELVIPEGLNFQPVALPHDWAVNMPFDKNMEQGAPQGFRNRWGIGWYRKDLEVSEKKTGYQYFLEFGGVYENCTVWVNGTYVGRQRYGYSSFRLDITEALVAGENEIVVKVDNSNAPVDRWYSGCGIYRTVKFVEVEEKHLEPWDVVVNTELTGEIDRDENVASALVKVNVGQACAVRGYLKYLGTVNGNSGEKTTFADECDNEVLQAESVDGMLDIPVSCAKLWSVKEPNLSELTLQLMDGERVADEVRMRIGIRQVQFDLQRGMLVNGNPEKLKGVCLHQEAGAVGIAMNVELWRERLEVLREMGCNAIRPSHHTFSEEFLDLCDEMGFYVYEECFDKWTSGLYGRYFKNHWQQDVEAMVKRDRNRACIVLWGVGNEVENQAHKSMLDILTMLRDFIRLFDTTRPISCAMNPHFGREKVDLSQVKDIQAIVDEAQDTEIYDAVERAERIKLIAEIVDIVCCNYQEQWYELLHEMIPDKLILGTEIYQYFHGAYDQMQNFTEKNPSLVALEKDYCIGGFIWTGYDYLGESMGYPAKGWSGAPIHTNNERRPAYYMLQSYWTKKPMVHFSVMDYSLMDEGVKEHWDMPIYVDHWEFPQFRKTLIPYMVATNCEEVAIYLNGKHFYLPKPSECTNGLITGFLPWQPGTVKVVGMIDGKEVCCHEVVTPGPAIGLKFDREVVKVDVETTDKGTRYKMLLTVRAMDLENHPCFRESGKVRFRVEGPAKLFAVDNGDITTNEPFDDDFVHLFRGCASAMIELTGEVGRVKVSAYGDGLREGTAIVVVE